jgi:class 3 adenylate cyclase
VQAAIDMRDAVKRIGLDIRTGVHTGEVEVVPGGIRGLAVHETARIMALGGAGEILLSDTTRAVSASEAFTYQDHGVHQLRGVPEPRRVFLIIEAKDSQAT